MITGPRRAGRDLDQAQVLLLGECLAGASVEAGRDNRFDEELGHLVGGLAVDGDD